MSTEKEGVKTVTLEELRAAQKSAPQAEETKALQRAYQAQLNAGAAAERARERAAEQFAENEERAWRREAIKALRLAIPNGMSVRDLSAKQAQYVGMAAKVAGGWVATALDGIHPHDSFVALVPDAWTIGVRISPETVREAWLATAYEVEQLEDALSKLYDLAE